MGIFNPKKFHILMIGLEDSGKYSIILGLKMGKWPSIPHIGLSNETVEYKRLIINTIDINEETKKFLDYYENINGINGIIFVFDSSNNTEEAMKELNILLNKYNCPFLIFANKSDLAKYEIKIDFKDKTYKIINTNAIKGEGIYEGLDWLNNIIF